MSQTPQVVAPDEQIELAIGESRTLKFSDSIQSAHTTAKGVAEIVPQTDRIVTVSGVAPGQTLMWVQDTTGRTTYTATITVSAGIGHLVRIYRSDKKDFIGFHCNETACGRADLDVRLANGGRDPDEPVSQSITITRPTGDGGALTTTNQYRR
jgi:hypothetical protein